MTCTPRAAQRTCHFRVTNVQWIHRTASLSPVVCRCRYMDTQRRPGYQAYTSFALQPCPAGWCRLLLQLMLRHRDYRSQMLSMKLQRHSGHRSMNHGFYTSGHLSRSSIACQESSETLSKKSQLLLPTAPGPTQARCSSLLVNQKTGSVSQRHLRRCITRLAPWDMP